MRWDDLFESLDGHFEELLDAADDAEQADRARVAFGAVSAIERLTGSLGATIRVRLPAGTVAVGVLRRVGPDFLLLRESPSVDLIIAWSTVTAVEGLSMRTGAALGTVDYRFDLRKAVRAVARDRAAVTVHTTHGSELAGTVDRVGADFFEISAHAAWEIRRQSAVRSVVLVPFTTVVSIRSATLG